MLREGDNKINIILCVLGVLGVLCGSLRHI